MYTQRGFTLIEISVVLVIIGLMAGGLLKSQKMIEETRFKNFKNQITDFSAAVYAFQNQFRYLPGDFPRASSTFTAPAGISIFDGNGNGVLSITSAWTGPSEQKASIQHLTLAGLLKGEVTNINGYESNIQVSEGWIAGLCTVRGGQGLCILNIKQHIIQRLDEELDDGNLATGKIWAWSHSNWGGNPQLYKSVVLL